MNKAAFDAKLLDNAIDQLGEKKDEWARLAIDRKIDYLRQCIEGTVAVAERQVAAALDAKGLSASSPQAGEEWLGGPLVTVRCCRLLLRSLEQVRSHGTPQLMDGAVSTRPDGQVVVNVFPENTLDKMLYAGFSAEVWMQPDVNASDLASTMAVFYKQKDPEGRVALVLGAGNVASIGPLDVIYKLFVEGQVCLLKMNPVNDYLGPYVEEAFRCLVDRGYLRFAYGGADVGSYLTQHAGIDEIHITGSDRTHDAIVFGTGEEGKKRKADNNPICDKRITSELGNVSPVIVVPGLWSKSELRFQAENIATQMTNNAGFNCNAAKVLVMHDKWPQRTALLAELRDVLAQVPQRPWYYPGAGDRWASFKDAHPQAETYGDERGGSTGPVLPWTLIPGVDSGDPTEMCFSVESFCGVTAETTLGGADAGEFLANAVRFCNERVWGTLNACIIVHPKSAAALGSRLEQAIADLEYGSIAINHWPALAYGLGVTTWGAYPGHTFDDIQSGIGVVHNAYMFDRPQKSVVRGPFKMFPKPPWFVTNKQTHNIAPKLVAFEQNPRMLAVPGIALGAIIGSF
ncbi:MAG: aldehyde dehydrogenase family protein [Myxococcales bacterium]|nr:aldehyde dehydrogenase family protein [Myxococcales bacterium]